MASVGPLNLHFEDSGDWYSLPAWAEYFINVGKQLASADQSNGRIVTTIVVPTRAFGAAFVSLGMVVADAAARDPSSRSAHFQKLFDLPAGTPVIFRRKPGQILKGILREPGEAYGKMWAKVQVNSSAGGRTTHLIDESMANQVQPAGHSFKLPKNQSGDNSRLASEFVDELLGDADPVHLGLRSKLVCALVGKRVALEHEIRHAPLSLFVNGDHHAEGHLQDVLRVNRFVTGQQSHRSALLPVGGGPPPDDIVKGVETGVIFDGALGFLKWGEAWPDRHQIIVLDRTDPYFDDAVSAINLRYSQKRKDGEVILPRSDAPPGGEVLAFREALE